MIKVILKILLYKCLVYRSLNTECHLVTPEEIKALCPLLKVDDLYGGLWIPGDGVGDPYQICMTLIEEAVKNGTDFKLLA